MNEWQQYSWSKDARKLLDWKMLYSRNPLALVIRHSHREESDDVDELLKLRLTSVGKNAAYTFGKKLPEKEQIKLFYSSHPRCVETAEEIVRGYNSVYEGATLASDIRVLLGPQGSGERIGKEMLSLGGPEFVMQWVNDELSRDTIETLKDFGNEFRRETLGRLRNASRNTIHLHVTHDLVLMGVRNVLFGTVPSAENWTSFLGGFGVTKQEKYFIGYEMGAEVELS